ncbi:MAG: hypothetical protein LBJ20_07870 [Candidatus Methanoplasma sp.]|jgi:hypothetical protein|nr:hypothetical protein [Candidatus Methanoplasma sp.]
MVSEIRVQCGKFLSLKNTVSVESNDIMETDSLISSSVSKLKAYGVSICGPLIVWAGIQIDGDKIKLERKIILQCKGDVSRIPKDFERRRACRAGPCMYARFEGDERNLTRAFET